MSGTLVRVDESSRSLLLMVEACRSSLLLSRVESSRSSLLLLRVESSSRSLLTSYLTRSFCSRPFALLKVLESAKSIVILLFLFSEIFFQLFGRF